ncbi:MAG: hypothetical protein HZB70_02805 [Candidatus Berkelbacteria bacterium]|nr:MAG: hypothetical protein HZB70_02805 [Candidatus Berkelbacteria bacterium]QQG51765.1 MAG: hypothetical protein HY845_00190 [Candidatus Berkelbacteria bacterium]
MDRETLLQAIREAAAQNTLTREEVVSAYDQTTSVIPVPVSATKHLGASEMLYYIGGAIVFLGIAIMIGGSWQTLSVLSRLLVTLGSGVVAYVLGAMFIREQRWGGLSNAFFLISALVLPVGLLTVYDAAGLSLSESMTQLTITAILTALFGISYWYYRKVIFTLFTVIFSTALYFSALYAILGSSPAFSADVFLYGFLVAGLTYGLLAYHFTTDAENRVLTPWLYTGGSLAFFGSALGLGGFSPSANAFWEIIYPGLVFGAMFLGINLKIRALLIWGAIFLMAYIVKITAEYFSQGLGWPLALVIAGLSLIGVGYYMFYLNRKYLSVK